MRRGLVCLAALASVAAATAAELPSRAAKAGPPEPKMRACEIAGEPGVPLPGGGCARVSGYVSAGVSAGTVKH